MVGTTFPAFIRAEYVNDGRAFEQFVSDVGRAGGKAKTAMEQALSGVRDTVAQALSVPRNAFGSLDVGVGELRKMEAQLEATAQASRQVQVALIAEARATDGNSQSKIAAIRAANQFARASEEELATLRQNIAFNERLQAELNKTAAAHQNVYGAAARGTTAYQANTQSVRAMRQATTQAGQQLQDIVISMGSGQRASTVLAQQLPQLAFAFSDVGGRVGTVARFLAGPWGVAVALGAFALSPFIDKLFGASDAADKASRSSRTYAEVLKDGTSSIEEITAAAAEYARVQSKANEVTIDTAQAEAALSQQRLNSAIAIREQIKATLDLYNAQVKAGPTGLGGQGQYAASVAASTVAAELADQDKAISRLTAAASASVNKVADEVAKINSDPSYQLDVGFDALRNDARNTIKDFDKLQKKLTEINNQEKAAQKALSESDKRPRNKAESYADGVSTFQSREQAIGFLGNQLKSAGFRVSENDQFGGVKANHPGMGNAAHGRYAIDVNIGRGVVEADNPEAKAQIEAAVLQYQSIGYRVVWNGKIYEPFGKGPGKAIRKGSNQHRDHAHFEAPQSIVGRAIDKSGSDVTALKEQQAEAAAFANELQKIDQITQRISGEFDDQPKLVDRIALSSLKLKQTTEDIDRLLADTSLGEAERIALAERKLALTQAQASVDTYISRQIQQGASDFNDQLQVQKLLIAGREDEAKILERIYAADKQFGFSKRIDELQEALKAQNEILAADDSSAQAKEKAKTIISETLPKLEETLARQKEGTAEIKRQQAELTVVQKIEERVAKQREAYRSYIDNTYSSLEKLLSGGKAKDFFKEFSSGFKQLQGSLLTDKLFGGAFDELRRFNNRRSPENIATSNLVEQVDLTRNSAAKLGDSFDALSIKVSGAANDNSPIGTAASNAALAAARASGGITVDGKKSVPVRLANESVTDFVTRLAGSIVTPFTTELDRIFGTKFFGGLSGVLTGALAGYARAGKVGGVLGGAQGLFEKLARRDENGKAGNEAAAAISAKLGQALKGAETGDQIATLTKALGIKSSRTGGQIGGAIGGVIKKLGPLGGVIGGVVGSLVGGLFKKTKKGSLTVSNSGISVSGAKSLRSGLQTGGEGIQDRIEAIAEQLGGGVGDYSASIRQKGKKFYVGSQKFDDIESAGEEALRQAIVNGAVTGLRAGAQKLIQAGSDLERQLGKAVKFQSIFDRLREYEDPAGAALERLNREFESLRSIAIEAGEGLVELERLYGLERAKVIEEQTERLTGSLRALIDDLKIGENGLDLNTRYANARAQFDPLANTIRSGGIVDADKFAEIARTVLELSRQINGSQSGYFAVFNDVLSLSQSAIDRQNAALQTATGAGTPFATATPSNDNTPVVGAIGGMSDTLAGILNTQTAILTAINGNLGNLSLQNGQQIYNGGGGLSLAGGALY